MARRAPGVWPLSAPSDGSICNCEIPATLAILLPIWLVTVEAARDPAPNDKGWLGCAACDSTVCPRAIRLMTSAGGSAGSEVYVVCSLEIGPSRPRTML